jgi:hypothetical protein
MSELLETRRDQLIEGIYDTLPATTYSEITDKLNKKGFKTNRGQVNNAIAHLRINSASYGWTIPHVKRGGPDQNTDEDRYIALLVDRDGHYELDQNKEAILHITNGIVGDLQQTATMMQNEVAAIRIAATHTRSINKRSSLNDLADDFSYIARKAAAVVRDLKVVNLA